VGIFEKINFAVTGCPEAKHIELDEALSSRKTGVYDVFIPEQSLLVREIRLPKMANSALNSAVRLNIGAETPFDLAKIFMAYEVTGKDTDRILVRQFLIRKSEVQEWREALEEIGIRVRRFLVHRSPKLILADYTDDLKRPYKKWRHINIALICALLSLVCVTGLQEIRSSEDIQAISEKEVESLRALVANLRAEIESQADRTGSIAIIQARQETALIMLQNFNILSKKLPEETWVSYLEMDAELVRINGSTKRAPTDLISLLSNEGYFGAPLLINSFPIGNGSGDQSFEIEIPVRSRSN